MTETVDSLPRISRSSKTHSSQYRANTQTRDALSRPSTLGKTNQVTLLNTCMPAMYNYISFITVFVLDLLTNRPV